jgi:ABC-type transport system involved in multi-copper enzyme maturation permease subunit
MTAPTVTPPRPAGRAGHAGFGLLLRAEWTKFRTVRGWVIGMIVAMLVSAGLVLLVRDSCSGPNGPCPAPPLGPGGESVTDSFYFVHQPLNGNGSITARMSSLTGLIPTPSSSGRVPAGQGPQTGMRPGLEPWSKAGIIIKASTRPGSAYAAMLVTGSHGVRMQDDYTGDTAGLPGGVSPASPRWLRLTRSGDRLTGYDSADGTHWTQVGTVTLAGLPSTVQAGMFATSPMYTHVTSQSLGGSSGTGGPTLATAVLDHLSLRGPSGGAWTGDEVGGTAGLYPTAGGGYHQAGGRFTVRGSGDIAPDVAGGGGGVSLSQTLVGTFAGLIAVIVVATMFITAEYRRGLIRTTLTASPRRGRVLAAKAIVVGAVTFAAGLVAVAIALPLGERMIRSGGTFIDPVPALTEVRMIAGTAALLAVAAVLALAIGAILRRSAVAVTAVIAAIVLPYILSTVPGILPVGAAQWLLRLTPAAAFAIQQPYPAYSQVTASYAPPGYFPLAPWAGFAVLCLWAALALVVAIVLLRRRDA